MSGKTNVLMESPLSERCSAAIAKAHLALGNFEQAKAALGRDISEHQAMEAFARLLPSYYLIMPTVAGTLDINDLHKRGNFYLQFMRGKIAAATGDVKTARAAFQLFGFGI